MSVAKKFEVLEDEQSKEIYLIDYTTMRVFSQRSALEMLMRTRIFVAHSEDGYKTELHKKICNIEFELLTKKLSKFRRKELNNKYNKLIAEFEKIPDFGRIKQERERYKWMMQNDCEFMVPGELREELRNEINEENN